MKILLQVLSTLLLVIASLASAASFDCNNAQTVIEKSICANKELSDMDSLLDDTYTRVRADQNLKPEDDLHLVKEQKLWLKSVRNRCKDESCLIQAYQDRINVLDPLADKNITCEKMRKYPQKIFTSNIDLGSGAISLTQVDYECPESVASFPFMANLISMAEKIRYEDGPQFCTGSIVNALLRSYYFTLSEAGFAPEILLREAADEAEEQRVSDYFKQWANRSTYNYQLYNDFNSELNQALIKLTQYYQQKFKFSASKSHGVANKVVSIIRHRAAGDFPHDGYKPSPQVALMAADTNSTLKQLKVLLTDHSQEIPKEDLYLGLETALLNNRSLEYIKVLTETFSVQDYIDLGMGHEPLLSLALGSNENFKFLLSLSLPIDLSNQFGKSSLFYAIGGNNIEATDLLLENHADPNHTYLSANDLRSASYGIDECVFPNLRHTKRTPLMHAAQNSNIEMMKLLLKYGARLNDVDEIGFNALDYAAMGHNPENESYLKSLNLKYGATVSRQESR